jgi:putative flavoprotein involved in K+ transport
MSNGTRQRIDTLVIGGGQAGLAVGYHLTRQGIPFQIVDANKHTGDAWRNRWDSLRLFTPNRFNSLPGYAIEGDDWGFPTKDEAADYLESYARHFEFPIAHEMWVERLAREGDTFIASAGDTTFEADYVIVAMANYQVPKTPSFADELDSSIFQVHIDDYENPGQLRDGAVLVVGLGNSGAEVAKELVADDRHVWLSGEPTAVQPFRPEKLSGRILMPIVGPVIFNRVLTTNTPMGRKARSRMLHRAAPLMRVKPKDLVAAGVQRVGRTTGVADGYPQLDDGTVLDVANVVWCTGFGPGFSWIDLDVFNDRGDVVHDRGIVEKMPGLYFVGLKFQYSLLSDTLLGVGRDAGYVVDHLAGQRRETMLTEPV